MPKKATKKMAKKKRKAKAVVVVPPDAAEVEVNVVLPAPLVAEPQLTMQARGKQLLIRIKNVVLKELGP